MSKLPTHGYAMHPPPEPSTPEPSAPSRFGARHKTILGCGGMLAIAFVLALIAAACSPGSGAEPVPAPTVTVTVTVTAQAAPPPSPTPSAALMPQAVGVSYADAAHRIEAAGGGAPQLASAYTDVDLPADPAAWLVCFQSPDEGVAVKAGETRVVVAAPDVKCPEKEGTRLRPEPAPAAPPAPTPEAKPKPEPRRTEDGGGGSGGSGTSGGGGAGGVQFGRSCSPVGASATTVDGRPAKCFMGKDGHARWGYRS